MAVRWLILIVFIAIIEFYSFQVFKTVTRWKWFLTGYQLLSLAVIIYIIYQFTQFDRTLGQTKQTLITLGVLLLVLVPKLVLSFFMLLEDVIRVFSGVVTYFMGDYDSGNFLPERRKFVSHIALGVAAVPFLGLIYGMTKGKYNFKVLRQTLYFPDLPEAFDGFTITQISDIHSGSFDNAEKINYAIDLINEQNSDMILFTGDIVNTHAEEMYPWIDVFNRIQKHEFGKFSVLGNHDYGEYVTWPSSEAKNENFEAIKELHSKIGFRLLLNEHVKIKRGKDEIAVVGVENWGHNFKKAGNIHKAAENLSITDFKILMSHDPSHWEYEVKHHPKNFQLTLSGHTHGFQFGIEIPGFFKWSPVEYVYKQWAGLYEEMGRYVYVNRGFGFHAYPGRVGIMPEITVFKLKKGEKVA